MKRPRHLDPPSTLSRSTPVPKPEAVDPRSSEEPAEGLDPTRYGDWEKKGIAIDF